MSLPDLCIRRPVFTVMLITLPVVLGALALLKIGVDLFPNVELPIVIVTASRPGASVEEMETGVTKVIEEAVNTISGIDELRSTTTEGLSVVTIQFLLSKDRDVAQQDVQGKVNTVLSQLPTGTETPIIDKFDVDAAPVMTIAVSGNRQLRELTELADKRIRENLSSLNGVGAVTMVGGRRRAINITVDTKKLEAYGLSIEQVRLALASQNLELPGGRVTQEHRELILRTMGRIEDPEQFRDIIVANVAGRSIHVGDLGGVEVVEDAFEEPRSLARLDGDNALTLVVQKQSGTNTAEVIDIVKARLAELQLAFRQEGKTDLRMQVIRDQSRFIRASLHEVQVHLVLGAVLVVLTILVFLRDWRTTIIAGVAIPVSIMAAFPIMKLFDLTLNNITLIALVLVIGIVIDDAVIVVENIFRWMESKAMSPLQAARLATQEITLAVVATTLSLVVIFLPIAFMSGTVGMFLRSFGITCAITIMVSLLVSLTLTPMLSSRFLRAPKHAAAGHGQAAGGVYGWLIERPYLACLRWSLRHRWVIVLATIVVTASIFPVRVVRWPGLLSMVGFDFVPKDDQSEFEVAISTPEGWSLAKTSEVFAQIERRLSAMPEVTHTLAQIGDSTGRSARGEGPVTRGVIYVRLVDLGQRKPPFTQFQVMAAARRLMRDYPDLRTSVQAPAAVQAGTANADIEFMLTGPDLDRLTDDAARMVARLRATQGLVDVDTTLSLRKPELRVMVDRERASDLGASIEAVASTLRILVGGLIVSDFRDRELGEQYDVWLRARGIDRNDRTAVANLTVPSERGGLVRLGNVAHAVEGLGPSQIDRAQRQRKISIIANLAGMPTGTASVEFQKAFRELNAPAAYALMPVGRAKSQAESVGAFFIAFLLSLVFMYMVLAAQFESFLHPITILLAVPFTIPFALLSLIALGQPLTLFSVLGLFLLFGIVKKNGILQVDYTNVLRAQAAHDIAIVPESERGPERVRAWAIIEANRVRLRPILMTTVMLITAMIPIALGKGPGAANRADMAKVIVGGQGLSLLLSLLVTPVAYSLFDDLGLRLRRRRRAASHHHPTLPAAGTATPAT